MASKEIRTHYSGFIVFAVKLVTVATGIAFTLIVANWLSQNEYGVWGIFNIIIPYFTLLSGAVSFWTMRFVARGREGASKTGVIANMTFGLVASLIYLGLIPILTTTFRLESHLAVYVVMATQILETYLIVVLESSLQASRPHFVGYGLLSGEVLKVLFAYVFIVQLQLGLLGAAFSVILAFVFKIVFYFQILSKELRQRFKLDYVREWFKGSTFNIYHIVGGRIASAVFFMVAIYGGEVGTSYYYAALQIANIITYSSFIAFALQPKLLAERNLNEVTTSLRLVMMFAIPMTVGVLALPGSFLVFLKESGEYIPATPILMILAVNSLILTISSILTNVLFGIERVDEKAKITIRKVIRSRLFIAFSLPYVQSAIALPATFFAVTNLAKNDPLLVATYATGISTIAHLATLCILYYVLRRDAKVNIPWRSISRYVLASTIMAIILYSVHPTKRSMTLIFTAIGGTFYLSLLLLLDSETRVLARQIWQTMRGTKKT